jgi:hypothetical protein
MAMPLVVKPLSHIIIAVLIMKLTLSMLLVIQPSAFVVPHFVRIDYLAIALEFSRSETANVNATLSPGVLAIALCLVIDPGTLGLYLF